MPEPSTLIIGSVSLIVGAMVSPFANDFYRKLTGKDYATKRDCKAKHDQMEKDCNACQTKTQASICAIQHNGEKNRQESEKNRKLLVLIAFRLRIPHDELKEFL